jgi:hypothetical protein
MEGAYFLRLLVFSIGVLAYGSVLVAWFVGPLLKAPVQVPHRGSGFGLALTLVGLCWFALNVAFELGPWAGPTADVRRFVTRPLLLLTLVFPPLIMQAVYRERSTAGSAGSSGPTAWAAGKYLLWTGWTSCALGVAFVLIDSSPQRHNGLGLWTAAMFVGASVYALASLKSGHDRDANGASERRTFARLFAVLGVLFVVIAILQRGAFRGAVMSTVSVIARSMPLAFLAASAWHGDRFLFVDVFAKRAMTLVVVLVAQTLTLAALLLLPAFAWLPPATAFLLSVAVLPAIGVAMLAARRLSSWLDERWLGRRYSPPEAVRAVVDTLTGARGEADFLAKIERTLSEIFKTTATVRVGADDAISADAVRVPIVSGGETLGTIVLPTRATRRPYFSEDLTLAAALATTIGAMLTHVRLQAALAADRQHAQSLALQASRSELKALRAQINPHFLFNALNAVGGLVHRDPERADQVVAELAEIFRYTLKRSDSEWAALDDEVAFAQAYLRVEQARFGDRLQVEIAVAPDVGRMQVPALLLQTLVENAVKHGVTALRGPAFIRIEATVAAAQLEVRVANAGPPLSDDALQRLSTSTSESPSADGTGYGLRHVRDRLRAHFAERAELSFAHDATADLTTVTIRLPATMTAHESVAADAVRRRS